MAKQKKYVYKIKKDVPLARGQKVVIVGVGEFDKNDEIHSDEPLENPDLEEVGKRYVAVDPVTEPVRGEDKNA